MEEEGVPAAVQEEEEEEVEDEPANWSLEEEEEWTGTDLALVADSGDAFGDVLKRREKRAHEEGKRGETRVRLLIFERKCCV